MLTPSTGKIPSPQTAHPGAIAARATPAEPTSEVRLDDLEDIPICTLYETILMSMPSNTLTTSKLTKERTVIVSINPTESTHMKGIDAKKPLALINEAIVAKSIMTTFTK